MSTKRNGEIDFFRFVFAILILMCHLGDTLDFSQFKYGNIGVEFFFLVTGFLMARSAEKHEGSNLSLPQITKETYTFLLKKVKVFYRYLLSAMLLDLLVRHALILHEDLATFFLNLLRCLPMLTLTTMGISTSNIVLFVGGSWYLSAMILSLFILYPLLLRSYSYSSTVIFPLISMGLIAHLYQLIGTMITWEKWTGIMYSGMERAIAEIALGAVLYPLSRFVSSSDKFTAVSSSRLAKIVMTAVKYVSYFIVLLYGYGSKAFKMNFSLHALLLCALAVFLSFTECGWHIKANRLTDYLGKVSLGVYIFHGVIRWCIKDAVDVISFSRETKALIILATIFASILIMHLVDIVWNYAKKHLFTKQLTN